MFGSDFKLLLIPVGLAVAFLLWVIWELEKQIRWERRRTNAVEQVRAGMDQPPTGGVAADEQSGTAAGAKNLGSALPSGLPAGFRVAVR